MGESMDRGHVLVSFGFFDVYDEDNHGNDGQSKGDVYVGRP